MEKEKTTLSDSVTVRLYDEKGNLKHTTAKMKNSTRFEKFLNLIGRVMDW